jgi:hypothetical protein
LAIAGLGPRSHVIVLVDFLLFGATGCRNLQRPRPEQESIREGIEERPRRKRPQVEKK